MSTQDLLLQQSNGNLLAWEVSAGSSGFTQLFQLASTQSIGAVGDVNGDGRADLYINSSAGNPLLWVNGGIGGTSFFSAPVAGTVLAIADISGATGGEIITRDGTNIRSYSVGTNGALTQNFSSGTTPFLAGVAADTQVFAGDIVAGGKSELVFVTASGASLYYNGTTFTDLPNTTTGISVVGVADLGFGSGAEILYRNTNIAGSLDGYFVYNATTKTFTDVVGITKGYNVIGLQDVTGDGVAEMIVSNGTQTLTFNTVSKAFENDLTGVANASGITVRGFGNFNGTVTPTFSLEQSDNQVKEGSSITYTVKATAPVSKDTTFTFTTTGDTIGDTVEKASGSDLTPASGTVTIKAGQTSATFTVTATTDAANESLEGFKLTLLDNNLKSVGTAVAIITDNSQSTGQTLTLTTGVNQLTGGAGSDTFDASSANSLQTADVLTGGAGTDSLNALFNVASTVRPTMTSVEDITLTNTQAVTFDLTNSQGVTAVRSQFATADLTVLAISDAKTTLEAISGGTDTGTDIEFRFANAALAGTADNATLQVNGFGDGTGTAETINVAPGTGSNSFETLTINATGGNSNFTLNGAGGATSVAFTGDANATVTGLDTLGVSNVDASKATGNLSFALTNATATLSGSTAVGGAGNDTITAGNGNDNLNGGAGNDRFVFGTTLTADDTVNGGNGTDTISLSGTVADSAFTNVTATGRLLASATTNLTLGKEAKEATISRFTTFAQTAETDVADTVSVGSGFDGSALTVILNKGKVSVDASASTTSLNVSGAAATFTAADTLKGGTGDADTITISADNDGTGAVLSGATGFEKIVVAANATTADQDAKISLGADTFIAADKTLVVDATALTNSAATVNFSASDISTDTKSVSVTGGAGGDTLTGGAGSDTISGGAGADSLVGGGLNDVLQGGAGADTINGGAGAESIDGGAGNDRIVFGSGEFTSADTVNGGGDTDTLAVAGTVADSAFTNVTNVGRLVTTAAGAVLTLDAKAAATITRVTSFAESAETNATDTIDVTSGFDGKALTFVASVGKVDFDASTSTVTVTASGAAATFTADDTIKGGKGTDDVLSITADDDGTGAVLTAVSGFEKIVVNANSTTAAFDAKIDLGADTFIAANKTLTVDGTALTDAGAVLTFDAGDIATATKSVNVTGGAGNDVLTGGAGNDSVTGGAGNDVINGGSGSDVLDGGAGADQITLGAGDDKVTGGEGNDTLVAGTNLDTLDSIDGGAGTDRLRAEGTLTDSQFNSVTNVERLELTAASTLTLNSRVLAAGITRVTSSAAGNETLANDVITVQSAWNGQTLNYFANVGKVNFDASGSTVTVNATGDAATFTAADTIKGGTGTGDTLTITADNNGTGAVLNLLTGFEKIVVAANTTATHDAKIDLNSDNVIAADKTLTVDATALTNAGATVYFDASDINTATKTLSITGGSGNDTLIGGAGTDTIVGGAGADSIDGDGGADSLTGGAGDDSFLVSITTNKFTFDTVTDIAAGDKITGDWESAVAETFEGRITLSGAAGFSDYLDAAAAGDGSNDARVSWFQFNGDTYVVIDEGAGATYAVATDSVIRLAGLFDLSGSSIANDALTIGFPAG
ncbi:MAG TPA: calcium-binding protein [Azospirillaceae bacterium]|nr:calcium-binding protein [Azospirillaceae bacterium]